MQAGRGRQNGGWVSPAIPTVANLVLGALWGFSAFGGWGRTAFCDGDHALDAHCAAGLDTAIRVSVVPGGLALLLLTGSWAISAVRRDPELLDTLLTVAALTWVTAEGILLVGGYFVQP